MMSNSDLNAATLSIKNLKSQLVYLPWHTLIFIAYMFLFGYQQLNGNIVLREFLSLMLLAMGISIMVFLPLQRLLGIYKASLIIFVGAVAFFLFGHIYHVFSFVYSAYVSYLPIAYTILIVALITLVPASKWLFIEFNKSLNILAIILGILASIQFVQYLQDLRALQQQYTLYDPVSLEIDSLNSTQLDPLPDIYYLVFDAYPNNDYLLTKFGIDNSEFTNALEDLGFYVAYDSISNYTVTRASLSSTLNLSFVQEFAPSSLDVSYSVLDSYMANSRVGRMLQDIGYHYVHFGNGLTRTAPSVADTLIEITSNGNLVEDFDTETFGKSSFVQYLYVTTWLRALDPRMSVDPTGFGIADVFSNVRYHTSTEVLRTIPAMEEPTFTYFHSTKPHLPVTMDAAGEPFDSADFYSSLPDYLENEEIHLADQIAFVNQSILETLEIIFNESDTPPIIILQADHGMVPTREIDQRNSLMRPISILNAFYFPDGDYSNLYQEMSAVNTFRVVFNQYYGANYPMLDDETSYYVKPTLGNRIVSIPLYFYEIPQGLTEPPYE